jgi:hypothetical protein
MRVHNLEVPMPTKLRADKVKLIKEVESTVRGARLHWLQQLLDWPLDTDSLAGRLTEAEVAVLRKAAEDGMLFYGTSGV